jgi:hypothetical protein
MARRIQSATTAATPKKEDAGKNQPPKTASKTKAGAKPQNQASPDEIAQLSNYAQVRRQATVSRMLGNEWYSGINKDLVLHIFEDQNRIETALFIKNAKRWTNCPQLSLAQLYDKEKLAEYIRNILDTPDGQKAKGICVMIHSARDYYMTLPRENMLESDVVKAMRAKTFPTETQKINDPDQDQYSWRWIPALLDQARLTRLPIMLSKLVEQMPDEINAKPVAYAIRNTYVDSLILIHPMSQLRKKDAASAPIDGRMSVFFYDHISLLILQNKDGETVLIKTYPHMQMPVSKDLAAAVFSSILDNERMNYVELRIFPMGQAQTQELLDVIVEAEPDGFSKTLAVIPFESATEVAGMLGEALGHDITNNGHPVNLRPDYFVYYTEKLRAHYFAPECQTYKKIRPIIPDLDFSERKASTVTRTDISLLLGGQLVSMVIMFALLGIGGFKVYEIYKSMKSPEWQLPISVAEESKIELSKVDEDFKTAKNWQSALLPRSKGWHQFEFLNSLFPEGCGFTIENFTYKTVYDQEKNTWRKIWDIAGKTDEAGNNRFRDFEVQKTFPKNGPYKLSEIDWTIQSLLENDSNLILNRKSRSPEEQDWKKKTAQTLTRPYVFTYRSTLLKANALGKAAQQTKTNQTRYGFTLKIEQEIGDQDPFGLGKIN